MKFQPPSVTFGKLEPASLLSFDKSYRLRASAEDDEHLKDYWVYVYTRKGRRLVGRKVAYFPNPAEGASPRKVTIDLPVPLREGINRIQLHMRDNSNLITTEELIVFHPDSEQAQKIRALIPKAADAATAP